ncbi:MAG: ferredoxin hydrogenase gamma subunit [Moritella sp.]|jgi:ferredoxin hydrogenase gamma subunit
MIGYIDNTQVTFDENETVLNVARRHDIYIPTLCELADIDHTPGTCRVCLVEVLDDAGNTKLVTSCTTGMKEGLKIRTKTPTVRDARRLQVELLLTDHNQNCIACSRHGDCELLDVGYAVGVSETSFGAGTLHTDRLLDTSSHGIVRDMSKCIRCMRCKTICQIVQGVDALVFEGGGDKSTINMRDNLPQGSSACITCGQCTLVCPTGALSVVDDTEQALDWLNDPEITTVVQFAPAVRISLGEEFGIASGVNTEAKVITALKRLGADIVVDTNFSADLVIMEEGSEFLQRFSAQGATPNSDQGTEQSKLPMFTSCCPGWVNYIEINHPDLLSHLSSTKSPQQCLGAIAKTYMAQRMAINPKQIRTIAIMPCTAKKDECQRPETEQDFGKEIDAVLTTRELADLLRRQKIDFANLLDSEFTDPLMGEYSGAGALFGSTGGVMEAAIRTVHKVLTGDELEGIEFTPVRGMANLREATITLDDGTCIRAAVCHGIGTARSILEDIKKGKSNYDFVEVMACPGGCISGGGQPSQKGRYQTTRNARIRGIYSIDKKKTVRQSHNNKQIQKLYDTFLEHPSSAIAHELLHTTYSDRSR